MVYNVPRVRVAHTYGYVPSVPADDQIFGYVVECTKGKPNEAVLIRTPEQLYQEFKVHLDAYFGVGGQALYVTRAACTAANGGTAPVKAVQFLTDTATTGLDVIKLVAKQEGSYPITLQVERNATAGNNVVISEEGYSSEYYIGITGIDNIVKRINRESAIVDAYYPVYEEGGSCSSPEWVQEHDTTQTLCSGTGYLETVTAGTVLGSYGTGAVAGANGTTHSSPAYAGQLPDANAPTAHAEALSGLEIYKLAGVFTTQVTETTEATVHAVYLEHVDKMNGAEEHGWRFAVLGAADGATKSEILSASAGHDRETVAYVGQGVIDVNEVEYSPTEAAQVVAGKIGAMAYYEPIWGGQSTKILGINQNGTIEKFIIDLVPLPGDTEGSVATREDLIEYNEKGVITFVEELDGIRVREGLTTVQNPAETAEDELAVMRIIRHVKYLVYDRSYEMLGQNITDTFKTDLEENIKSGLEAMKTTDRSILDIPESGLSAYTVSVSLMPRTVQKEGKVTVNVAVTPVHAAREIECTVVVM